MKITPLEIRQKTFEKGFRGYDKEEVIGYLKSLSQEWEKLLDEKKELNLRLENSEKEVKRLRDVESSLFKALKTAEDTGASMIDQANKSAALHLKESQINAEGLLNEAKQKAKSIIEQAEQDTKSLIDEMETELKNLLNSYKSIENEKDNLIAALRSTANETIEKAERLDSKNRSSQVDELIKSAQNISKKFNEQRLNEGLSTTSKLPDLQLNDIEEQAENTDRVKAQEKKETKQSDGSFFDQID